jgi:SAM-dependent methyltransferase/uncharacterized protein YbaR (Trm112 family)
MWYRIANELRCPLCGGGLRCEVFDDEPAPLTADIRALAAQLDVWSEDFNRSVREGLLLCDACQTWFPITRRVPVLLPYALPLHTAFLQDWNSCIAKLSKSYQFPNVEPMPGERQVLESFSKEWLEYSYDGVLWTSTYDDQEAALRCEVPLPCDPSRAHGRVKFLEVGCGLGVITYLAHKNWRFDAVGVDLSYAAFRAAEHYRGNPFLHFVQASAFYLPFEPQSFDTIYSRGVLHHTYSTRAALERVAAYSRPGGGFFVWLYGPGSTRANTFRRIAYSLECAIRPVLSARPSSLLTNIVLRMLSLAYVAVNGLQRLKTPQLEKYTFTRALHAARDRFTPRYAHRQSAEEVAEWFKAAGYAEVTAVDWTSIPNSLKANYRRNVALWATKAQSAAHAL